MITIRHSKYTDEELAVLWNLLYLSHRKLIDEECGEHRCIDCPYRHVCADLEGAVDYLFKYFNRNDGE